MISHAERSSFMNRQLKDWRFLKNWGKRTLMRELKTHAPNAAFKLPPYAHQIVGFLCGHFCKRFLYLFDMGTGKTKIVLDVLKHRKDQGKISKILFIVERVIHINELIVEGRKHSDFTFAGLHGTKEEREKALEKDMDIYVINYAGLQVIAADFLEYTENVEVNGIEMKKVRKKRELNARAIMHLGRKFDAIVFDEMHNVKNKDSLVFKICKELVKRIDTRYGLTGTPFDKNPIDLWALFYLIDGGETFGVERDMMECLFFDKIKKSFKGHELKLRRGVEEDFNNRLNNRALVYMEEECTDLPDKVYKRVPLFLTEEAADYYNMCIESMASAKGDRDKLQVSVHQLRRILSGYASLKMDEQEDFIHFKDNPKMEYLLSLINGMPADSKMIVFCDYVETGAMIQRTLTEEKIKCIRLYGATKNKAGTIETFRNDPTVKVFIANTTSGGTGVNLQVANYVYYYESPVSYIKRKQSEKRAHRDGQKKTVFIYDPVFVGCTDETNLERLKLGQDYYDMILKGEALPSRYEAKNTDLFR